jgi:thioredoxin-like negative regulator of GroEL
VAASVLGAAECRGGQIAVVSVDVDADPALARRFRVWVLPAVRAVRDGAVVDGFTGAHNRQRIERCLDAATPESVTRPFSVSVQSISHG